MEDQKVVQTFSSYAPQKAFTHGIRAVRVRYGVRRTLMPLVAATRAKCCPNVRSLSRIRYFGVCLYGVASRSCCATQGSVGERVTLTWMTLRDAEFDDEEGKQRTKEQGSRQQAHHRPTPLPYDCAGTFSRSAHGSVLGEPASYTSEWSVYSLEYPAKARSPRMRSAPQSRLFAAIS
jgi:hypothetical protein